MFSRMRFSLFSSEASSKGVVGRSEQLDSDALISTCSRRLRRCLFVGCACSKARDRAPLRVAFGPCVTSDSSDAPFYGCRMGNSTCGFTDHSLRTWRLTDHSCFYVPLFRTLPPGVTSESSRAFSKAIGHQVLTRLAKQALRHVHASGRGDGYVFGGWYGGHKRERRSPRHLR